MRTMKFRAMLIALVVAAKAWLPEQNYVDAMKNAATSMPSVEGQEPTISNLAGLDKDVCDTMRDIYQNTRQILLDDRAPQQMRAMFVDTATDEILSNYKEWLAFIEPIINTDTKS